MTDKETERIRKQAYDYYSIEIYPVTWQVKREGYIAGATAENERMAEQENSEVPLTEHNAEIRTIRAQWIGMKDENDNLMTQIEYLNNDAKESHDRIMKLEFQLKQERSKAIDACIEIINRADGDGMVYAELLIKGLEALKS